MKIKRAFLCLGIAAVLLCLCAVEGETALSLKQYRHTAWSSKDGAPLEISALAQSNDGMLWLGTTTGLVRFDGLEFHPWEPRADGPQMPSRNISALLSEGDGSLWIGYRFGGISLLKDGRLTNFREKDGLPSNDVQQIALDAHKSVWAVAGNRLMHLEGARWVDHSSSFFKGGVRQPIERFLFDRNDCLWVAVLDHIVIQPQGDHPCGSASQPVGYATGLVQAPSGQVWLSDYWRSATPVALNGVVHPTAMKTAQRQGSNAILFAGDRSLWIATTKHGIERRPLAHENGGDDPNRFRQPDRFTEADGLTSSETSALLQDREGNIWVGTSRGLDCFSVPKFVTPFQAALHGPSVLARRADGGVWIADPYFKLFASQQDRLQLQPFAAGAYALYAGSEETLWAATPKGLLQYNNGHGTLYPFPAELANLVVQCIEQGPDGDLLVSFTYSGVWRLSHGHWIRGIATPGLPTMTPLAMMADNQHRTWFGYVNNSAALWDGKRVMRVPVRGDLGQLLVLYQDGDRIWAGGSNGLAFFDNGSFRKIALGGPSSLRGISGIVRARSGDLWLNGASGIVRVPAVEIQRALADPSQRLDAEVFDYRDGVDGHAPQLRPMPSAVADAEGRIWFATSGGVLVTDPDHLPRNTVPPLVSVQAITVDGNRYEATSPLTLNVRSHKIQIAYIGLSLSSPDRVRYRYQLVNEDAGWQEAGTERIASYTDLPPGNYRFFISARNSDGVWSETSVVSTFSIPPALTQTRSFFAACILVSVMLFALAYALRMRYVTARIQERMRERVSERLLIARDLHDTLLQGMQGLIMRLHFTASGMPAHDETRDSLMSILDRADEVLEESRDSLLQLRSDATTHVDLAESLIHLAAQLRNSSTTSFTFTVDGQKRPVHALVREEVVFIFREALTNALQHSGAEKMTATLVYGAEELRLRFSDDGVGLSPLTAARGRRQGHWGVQGMRERAARIGGKIEISAALNTGTSVELRVPAGSAYLQDSSRSQWKRMFRALRRHLHLASASGGPASSHFDGLDLR